MTRRLVDLLVTRLRVLEPDDGDVPGWVMITVMTAAVAMVLWGLASHTFTHIFNHAFGSVGPK